MLLLLQLGNFMLQFPLPVKRAALSLSLSAAATVLALPSRVASLPIDLPRPLPPPSLLELREVWGEGIQEAWRWHWQYALCITYFPFVSFLPSFFIACSSRRGGDACTCKCGTVCARVCVLVCVRRIQPHHKTERPALFNPLLPSPLSSPLEFCLVFTTDIAVVFSDI